MHHLASKSILFGLFVVFSLVAVSSVTAQSTDFIFDLPLQACANIFYEHRTNDVSLLLNGTRAIFRVPDKPGGVIDEGSGLYFSWSDVREQGRGGKRCAPLKDEIIYAMSLTECKCNMSQVNRTENGVSTIGFEAVISGCPAPQPNLVATASFGYTNKTVIREYGPTLPFSEEEYFNYTSTAGNWKFSIHVEGWTWNETHIAEYPNNTYVAAGIQLGWESSKNLTLGFYNTSREYSVAATFGKTELDLKMDLGMLLDNQPSISSWAIVVPNFTIPDGTGLFAIEMPIHFCEPVPRSSSILRQWNSMFNDPSVQVIFSDLVPDAPLSPQERKSKRTAAIVAPVVTVAVVAIVVIIVLLVMFNHTVRDAILPHNRERIKEARGKKNLRPDSWTAASKPSIS